jgi:DNA-binding Xre family transcriptional regulator
MVTMRRMSVNEVTRTPLAKWMFRFGVSGRELSNRTGVSEAIISRLKTGDEVRISEDTRSKILEATGLKRL